MLFKNSFSEKAIEDLSNQVYFLIKGEPKLTNRSRREIIGWMKNHSLHLALEDGQVRGFIVREKMTENFYEIKSLFVKDDYREVGLGGKLLRRAVKDESKNYLSVTFQERIVRKVTEVGYKRASFADLPLGVSIKYLIGRNLNSVLRHLFKAKSTLLVKNAR